MSTCLTMMSLAPSAQRQASSVIGSRQVGARSKSRGMRPGSVGQGDDPVGARPAESLDQPPQPVLVGQVAVGQHGQTGRLLFREDDPGELVDDLEMLVVRDLPGGDCLVQDYALDGDGVGQRHPSRA